MSEFADSTTAAPAAAEASPRPGILPLEVRRALAGVAFVGLSVASVVTTAAYAPQLREPTDEESLAEDAVRDGLGLNVHVRCLPYGMLQLANGVTFSLPFGQEAGGFAQGTDIWLNTSICEQIAKFHRDPKVDLSQPLSFDEYDEEMRLLDNISYLAHEAGHTTGEGESGAQCFSAKNTYLIAEALGADPSAALIWLSTEAVMASARRQAMAGNTEYAIPDACADGLSKRAVPETWFPKETGVLAENN